jgi:zinc transporter
VIPFEQGDRGEALRATVREPGTIWCYSCLDGLADKPPPTDAPFRWLHLNLADQRSLRWLERESGLPPPLLAFIGSTDPTLRFAAVPDGIGLVLHDFEREFDSRGLGAIAPLQVVLLKGLLITGRRHPVQSADLLRQRLDAGTRIEDDVSALTFLITTLVDSFSALMLDLSGQLLEAESELMANERTPDTRQLMTIRRRSAQLHKLIGNLRALLQRMGADRAVPRRFAEIPRTLLPRLAGLETEIMASQGQLRLIREEIDLQVTQRVNENLYLLSIITALAMPATLVTGFFGMNTGGMLWTESGYGTLLATMIMVASAAGTYWLLRIMGMIRTR